MATEAERNRGAGAYSTPGVDPTRVSPYASAAAAPVVGFRFTNVDPPSTLYITKDDHIQVRIRNSAPGASLDLHVRELLPDGVIHHNFFTLIPTSDRTVNTFFLDLAEGFVLNLSVGATNFLTVRRGQMYVSARIVRGSPNANTTSGVLISGYVAGLTNLVWPYTSPGFEVDGPGVIRSIVGTTPAAGAEVTEVVPANARWLIRSFLVALTTSATVANRRPSLILDDGVNTFYQSTWNFNQPAGQTTAYTAALGSALAADPNTNAFVNASPNVILSAGFRIRTGTALLQAGDQWASPKYEVEEWIEGTT